MTALDEAIARVRSWRDWCAQGKNLYERQELTDAVLLLEELERRGVAQHLELINDLKDTLMVLLKRTGNRAIITATEYETMRQENWRIECHAEVAHDRLVLELVKEP